jgi:hypothetical protein
LRIDARDGGKGQRFGNQRESNDKTGQNVGTDVREPLFPQGRIFH